MTKPYEAIFFRGVGWNHQPEVVNGFLVSFDGKVIELNEWFCLASHGIEYRNDNGGWWLMMDGDDRNDKGIGTMGMTRVV